MLPAILASSPYAKEFVSTAPGIIPTVYHDYLGWFDGDVAKLIALSTQEWARRWVEAAGGENSILKTAKKYITEHTQAGRNVLLPLVLSISFRNY